MKNKVVKIPGIVILVLIALVFIFAKVKRVTPLSWGHKSVNTPMFSDEAINGYDPVSYFVEGKPEKGNEAFSYNWNDATWHFVSEQNMNLFKSNPEKYAPQFGGYCAFAASKGFTANTDPNAFKIMEGKLYLCADPNILKQWLEGGEESLKESVSNWSQK
jgi:YHS domain-containing protein